jgi:GDP-L-fucose synthase
VNKNSKIYIAGHRGLVGSAILRKLKENNYINLIYKISKELDLRRQSDIEKYFEEERPEYVFLAAAKVGGILANINKPASFIYDNLLIQSNTIHSAYKYEVKKLLFISSSCSYPRLCSQPMKEEYILSGELEPTNEYYAIAKIAGMKMIEAYFKQYKVQFISLIFPNIYGPYDNFDLYSSHVIPALIRKIYDAKVNGIPRVEIWGTGNARREFLYVDDVADACTFFMNQLNGGEMLNVGGGKDIAIKELAYLIKKVIDYDGDLFFNTDKPDGMPQKLLDVSHIGKFGWQPRVLLEKGIHKTFQWFVHNYENVVKIENDKN